MSILLSIIVPVYNVGSFLPKCIDSIISQTFTDFELILVDDGSTDNSVEICAAAAKKDSRVRVIHTENGGVVSAIWLCVTLNTKTSPFRFLPAARISI